MSRNIYDDLCLWLSKLESRHLTVHRRKRLVDQNRHPEKHDPPHSREVVKFRGAGMIDLGKRKNSPCRLRLQVAANL